MKATPAQQAWINLRMSRTIEWYVGGKRIYRKPVDYKLDIAGMGVFFIVPANVVRGRTLAHYTGPYEEQYIPYPSELLPKHKRPRRGTHKGFIDITRVE